MKSSDWKDLALRALLLLSGITAAALFVSTGQQEVLPPLAIGGVLGAFAISWLQGEID